MCHPNGKFQCSVGRRVQVVTNRIRGRSSISLSRRTKDALDAIKHPGQSCDGLIQELIKLWEKEHGVEETARAPSAVERGK